MSVKIGVRWDDESQNSRLIKAKKLGLVDFIEVNYPIAPFEKPFDVNLPIYAHSAYNGLSSAFGFNTSLVNAIKDEANKYHSPWVGEHLAWIAPSREGALGYVFNSIYNQDFIDVTVENIFALKEVYGRPIALELGPQYSLNSTGLTDIDFHLKVAKMTESNLILDLTHLLISNHNLNRRVDFGIRDYREASTIEVHVAGIRKSQSSEFWHDCHDVLPDETTLGLLAKYCEGNSTLKAVTFEHASDASEQSFFEGLRAINDAVGASGA